MTIATILKETAIIVALIGLLGVIVEHVLKPYLESRKKVEGGE